MALKEKVRHILEEMKGHAPFTCIGAMLGIVFMLLFINMSGFAGRALFAIFHPAHVFLSALVTTSMFKIHIEKKRFLLVLAVGYFGSVGIATLSDIVIPHFGSKLLGLDVPTHAQLHQHDTGDENKLRHQMQGPSDEPGPPENGIHLGFIEEWYIVNPAALLGILIACFLQRTKFPHAGHVLISTWASASYLLMTVETEMTIAAALGIFVTLFIATWIPCCISDIIFPLMFVKSDIEMEAPCSVHDRHSHPHVHRKP